jgi:hypothetical protein
MSHPSYCEEHRQYDYCKDDLIAKLTRENVGLRVAIQRMKESQVTHFCANCERLARELKEATAKLGEITFEGILAEEVRAMTEDLGGTEPPMDK